YGHFSLGEQTICGVAEVNPKDLGAYWVPLMSVPDVDKAWDQVRDAGGKSLKEPFNLSGRGRIAVVTDPQGAAFAVVRTSQGDPPDLKDHKEVAANDWLWNEVWADDPDKAAAFYQALAGYQEEFRELAGKKYRFLKSQDRPRVGLPQKPAPQ